MNYLNTGNAFTLFKKAVTGGIYVDKSMLIDKISAKIGTNSQYICITRPRRFGKSMNLHMLGAYYTKGQDSRLLFDGYGISKTEGYEKHRNRYNVIHIDFSRMPDNCRSYQDFIDAVIGGLREDLTEAYPELLRKEYGDKDAYLEFLKNLLKDQPYVELAYMTGVLPVAKYSSGSGLNMFREYHFMNDYVYGEFFGILEDEASQVGECCFIGRGVFELLDGNGTDE